MQGPTASLRGVGGRGSFIEAQGEGWFFHSQAPVLTGAAERDPTDAARATWSAVSA